MPLSNVYQGIIFCFAKVTKPSQEWTNRTSFSSANCHVPTATRVDALASESEAEDCRHVTSPFGWLVHGGRQDTGLTAWEFWRVKKETMREFNFLSAAKCQPITARPLDRRSWNDDITRCVVRTGRPTSWALRAVPKKLTQASTSQLSTVKLQDQWFDKGHCAGASCQDHVMHCQQNTRGEATRGVPVLPKL